jgi:hypothetical protein
MFGAPIFKREYMEVSKVNVGLGLRRDIATGI